MKKNRVGKRFLSLCIAVVLLAVVLIAAITKAECYYYGKQVNGKIAQLVGNLKEQYPELEEEQIIQLLNESGNSETGYRLMAQYGIGEDSYAILDMQEWNNRMILVNVSVLSILALLLLLLYVGYLRNRQQSVDALTLYVRAVAKGNYALDLGDNTEDELSNLKNELYKITVMLKEQADTAKAQKIALADSVSDISHQLKTPLTSISVLLDNLSESEDMDSHIRMKFLGEITRQIQQMHWLVISLLKLSRLDAGVVEFETKKIHLDQLLAEITENLEIIAELKSVEVRVTGTADICIMGDYSWNREAIQNIIKNAVEHAKEGSSVTVTAEDNSVYTKISVRDFGGGIKAEDLKHIFERFYKSGNTCEQSMGIGLSLAKSIIEKQNGYLAVQSEEGMGTTFVIKYLK